MMQFAFETSAGRRKRNEDCYFVPQGDAPLLAVADGMGGHSAGDVASALAIDAIAAVLNAQALDTPEGALRLAISEANRVILERASETPEHSGMGTTLTAALLLPDRLIIANVGDSRGYLFNGEGLRLLTRDHSLVEELVTLGQLTQEEAFNHPRRNVITRALGTSARVDVDIFDVPWNEGEILMLCTDGLSSVVPHDQIEAILKEKGLEACPVLISLALELGGTDNITVLLARNTGGDAK